MLRAGKFNCRIDIEAPTFTKGTSGGIKTAWAPVASQVWATRTSKSGFERAGTSAGGEVAVAREEFFLYWRPGITAEMRVVLNGQIFNIKHVNPVVDRRRALLLTCESGLNNG